MLCKNCFKEKIDLKNCYDCEEPVCIMCRYNIIIDKSERIICESCIYDYNIRSEEDI